MIIVHTSSLYGKVSIHTSLSTLAHYMVRYQYMITVNTSYKVLPCSYSVDNDHVLMPYNNVRSDHVVICIAIIS